MKKNIVLVLLVPILAIALISCDADMRSSFADFLGGFGGNVYVDGGLVEPNTADAKAATETIANLGKTESLPDAGDGKVEAFGIAITPPPGVAESMPPQDKVEQEKLKDDISNTLNSDQQKEEFKKEMKKSVSEEKKKAVEDTAKVYNATITALADKIPDGTAKTTITKLQLEFDEGEELTEGDALLVQIMTNLLSNTIDELMKISGDNLANPLNEDDFNSDDAKDALLTIFDEAIFASQIAGELGGITNLNLLEGINFDDLDFGRSVRRQSRENDGVSLGEAGDFITIINSIGPKLVNLFDLELSDGDYRWKDGGYRSMISNFQTYRRSIEHALSMFRMGNLKAEDIGTSSLDKMDESTPVLYLLTVIITEANSFDNNFGRALIPDFMNNNRKFASGTLTISDEIFYEAGNGVEDKDFEAFAEWIHSDRDKEYVESIFENVQLLDEIGGSGFIKDPIHDFLTEVSEEGKTDFDEFWDDLPGEGD